MSTADNPYASWGLTAAEAPTSERAGFIRQTYLHLAGAVLAFVGLEAVLLNLPITDDLVANLMMRGQWAWLIVLGLFIGTAYIANAWASSSSSVGMQYAGLGLYVAAQAVIFVPLLWMAQNFGGPQIIPMAGMLTVVIFTGLTAIVFITGADFSFLRTALMVGGFAALAVILFAVIFGFQLGLIFAGAMIALAAGYILYDTSNVLHHYRIGQHVAASLALFASVALMFYYLVILVMSLTGRD